MSDFDPHALSRDAERVITRGYRTLNLKTVCIGLVVQLARDLSEIECSRVAYCLHHQDGFVDHVHLVAQFTKPQHLARLLRPIAEADPCFYLRPCRTFRNSYRYLAHLDSPEKHRVDITSIVRLGDWDGTPLAEWHLVRRLQIPMQELLYLARDYLRLCRTHDIPVTSIGFSIFLDDHCVSSRSTLSSLRFMGIPLDDVFHAANALPNRNDGESENDSDN